MVMRYVKCLFSLQRREYFSECYVLVPRFPAITPVPQRAFVKASDDWPLFPEPTGPFITSSLPSHLLSQTLTIPY